MKNIKSSIAFSVIVGLVILTTGIKYMLLSSEEVNLNFFISCFSASTTVCTTASILFCSYLWKFKLFNGWFVLIPVLNGTWKGSLTSSWNNQSKPINITLEIRQSLFKISCTMITDESKSESISFDYIIDENSQQNKLIYIYRNTPKSSHRGNSPIHYGSVILEIGNNTLNGMYWTDRKTIGDINLTRL